MPDTHPAQLILLPFDTIPVLFLEKLTVSFSRFGILSHGCAGDARRWVIERLLSFRLSRFTLSQPLPELPLTFFAFVVGEDVRQDAPGDVLNFVLRNTGIVDELLLAAQAGCSLRFDMKFLRYSCGWVDDLLLSAWLPS